MLSLPRVSNLIFLKFLNIYYAEFVKKLRYEEVAGQLAKFDTLENFGLNDNHVGIMSPLKVKIINQCRALFSVYSMFAGRACEHKQLYEP